MRVRKLISIILASIMMLSLAGCKKEDPNRDPLLDESKETLVQMINDMNTDMATYLNRITELEDVLKRVDEEKGPTSAITKLNDGTGKETFNTVDNTFTLPIEFKYPDSAQAPNTSSINISEAVKITPTSNWVCKLNGTTLELSHSSGIAGTITVGSLSRDAQKFLVTDLQPYMDELLKELPIDSKRPSKLFLNDTQFGVDNISHTYIDQEDAMLRLGLLGYGDVSIQYVFVYKGEQDSAKDETIISLMSTVKVWNNQLSIA